MSDSQREERKQLTAFYLLWLNLQMLRGRVMVEGFEQKVELGFESDVGRHRGEEQVIVEKQN